MDHVYNILYFLFTLTSDPILWPTTIVCFITLYLHYSTCHKYCCFWLIWLFVGKMEINTPKLLQGPMIWLNAIKCFTNNAVTMRSPSIQHPESAYTVVATKHSLVPIKTLWHCIHIDWSTFYLYCVELKCIYQRHIV